jgi:hypothetical protein
MTSQPHHKVDTAVASCAAGIVADLRTTSQTLAAQPSIA